MPFEEQQDRLTNNLDDVWLLALGFTRWFGSLYHFETVPLGLFGRRAYGLLIVEFFGVNICYRRV